MALTEDFVEAIVAGARNPINWIVFGRRLKRSADVLFEKWQGIQPLLLIAGGQMSLLGGDRAERKAAHDEWRRLLEESMSYPSPAAMLLGFSVECYLKGFLVLRDPTVVKPPPKLFGWDHRLSALAKQARLDVTVKETELLERLTIYTTWAGRYPSPMKPAHAKPDQTGLGPAHWSTNDQPIIDDLIRRLDESLWAEILRKKNGPGRWTTQGGAT